MKEFAIIVAGGSGTRMQSDIPKQFLLLSGKPVLMRTVEAFRSYASDIEIIVVLPEREINLWNQLCKKHDFNVPLQIAIGGTTRFQSVKNGLDFITENNSLVAIHDGVRPLVAPEIVGASFKLAQLHGCAVASTRLKESLRLVDKDFTKSIDRSDYRSIQTPQTFRTDLIKEAYAHAEDNSIFTDDASVAERNGVKISLFEGSYENIKITTQEDLLFAEAILSQKK